MFLVKAHILGSDTNADNQSCGDRTDLMKERVSGKKNFIIHFMKRFFDAEDCEKICVKRIAQACSAVDAKGQVNRPALTYYSVRHAGNRRK